MEENIYTLNGITARFTKEEKIQTDKDAYFSFCNI